MTGDKRKRLTVALTAGATLLVLILFVVVFYQIGQLGVGNGWINDMEAEIEALTERREEIEGDLEYLQSEEALRELLIKKGYVFK